MNLEFSIEQNIFLQEKRKIVYYLYQLKNTLNILVAVFGLIRGNLMECRKKKIENLTKSDRNFALTFVDHHIL